MSIGENSFPILKYIQTYVYGFRAFYLQNKHTHTKGRENEILTKKGILQTPLKSLS